LNNDFSVEIPVSETTPLRAAVPGAREATAWPAGGAPGVHDATTRPAADAAATTANRKPRRLPQETGIPIRSLSCHKHDTTHLLV